MKIKHVILFLVLNFLALGIGGFLMGGEVMMDWYRNLNRAPWEPPGPVFGIAWTTIMICFAFYMAFAIEKNIKSIVGLFAVQWVLNVSWNPIFFKYHQIFPALIVIVALTLLIAYFLLANYRTLRLKSLLIMPYFVWLLIATSLNWYAWAYN